MKMQKMQQLFCTEQPCRCVLTWLEPFSACCQLSGKGEIDPNAKATCEMQMGAIERWDGHRGFGPLNAKKAMDRACELAKSTESDALH